MQVNMGIQAKTVGWTERDPYADRKRKAADEAARKAKEAVRTVRCQNEL